jgi:hypothetical protein
MPISLVINGTSYNYPVSGENPEWGEDASAWAQAVTDALATLLSTGDILDTTSTINNNISSPTNINGAIFDPGTVRAANLDYAIYRISTSNPSGHAETGTLFLIYDDSAAVNQKWQLSQRTNGSSGVSFSITDNGQIQYISTDIGAIGYVGNIKFRAKALTK